MCGWARAHAGGSKKMTCPPFLAIEKLRSSSNLGGVFDGNQKTLITSQHTPTIGWQLKFFGCQKGHWEGIFFFQNWYYMHLAPIPPFFSNQKNSVTIWHTPPSDGDQKGWRPMLSFWGEKFIPCFLAIRQWGYVWWRPNFFGRLKRHVGKGMKWQ